MRYVLLLLALGCVGAQYKFAAYFANWAQYHKAPYGPYTPTQLEPIMKDLDTLLYSFAYFDPDSEQMKTVEPKDPQFIRQIMGFKGNTKVLISVGGWNFDSSDFSKMVATNSSRASFIRSAVSFMKQYDFDGLDVDWEYPCSAPRTDYVKYSCDKVTPHTDAGGKCPDDKDNLLYLMQELRRAAPTKYFTIAGQAAAENMAHFHLKELSDVIDMWHVMSYDYSVSDISSATTTAPNCPLNDPGSSVGGKAGNWSIDTTVKGYLAAGVPAKKIMIGAALYGHTWYTPGLSGSAWQKYGVTATKQNSCCGPFLQTYGAKYGVGSQLCGTLMTSEIEQALGGSLTGSNVFFEKTSGTNIGYTSEGVWISFDNLATFKLKTDYVKAQGLAGLFTFDTSEDTISGGQHTYEMMKSMRANLGPSPPSPPSPSPPPTPSPPGPPAPPSPSGSCTGKAAGTYCLQGIPSEYETCPGGTLQKCPSGLHCTQPTPTAIKCVHWTPKYVKK